MKKQGQAHAVFLTRAIFAEEEERPGGIVGTLRRNYPEFSSAKLTLCLPYIDALRLKVASIKGCGPREMMREGSRMAMFGTLSQNRGESDTLSSQFGGYDSVQLLRLAVVSEVMGVSLGTSGEGHQFSVAFPLVRIEPAVRRAQAIARWG